MRYLLDSKPEREARRQLRLLIAGERRWSRQFASVIARGMRDMAQQYERTGTVPPLPVDLQRRIEAAYMDLAATTIEAFGGRILGQGKAMGLRLEHKAGWAEFFQRLAIDWLAGELIRRRITSITETTRRNIVDIVQQGDRDGLGVAEIARMIRDRVPGISQYRGALIARTETHAAANFGANEAARATGLDLMKEWVSVEDHRTRDFGEGDGIVDQYNHRSMNGQSVPMDQPFKMPVAGGEPIPCMFPGDPSLPAGASINCRCAVVHGVAGLE